LSTDLDHIRAAFEHHIALYGSTLYDEDDNAHANETTSEAVPEVLAKNEPVPDIVNPPEPVTAPVVERVAVPVAERAPEPVAERIAERVAEPVAVQSPVQPVKSHRSTTQHDMYERIAALIPSDSPLHAMQTLEEVSDYVAHTMLIELDKTRLNPVFGVGNPKADLLVIGEAPGAEEDKQGEPFVGRAGKLLTDILAAIGFERSDVYIANILKSRPPNNRDPLPDEIKAHVPILHKQIVLIQPKLILCVGRTSGTSLLGIESTLGDMRGIFHDYHGIPVMVTYHPAALLRNSNWKRPTWEDVKLLRTKYDELVT